MSTHTADDPQHQSSAFEAVPIEILDEIIVGHCNNASQKQLRLTCKALNVIASPPMFEHLNLALFPHQLSNLQRLAHSPLAEHIKHMTVHCDVLPPLERPDWAKKVNLRLWERKWDPIQDSQLDKIKATCAVDKGVPRGHACPRCYKSLEILSQQSRQEHFDNLDPIWLDQGWQAFSKYRQGRVQWRYDREGQTLAKCFALLTNLASISIKCSDSTSTWSVWRRFREEALIGPSDWLDWTQWPKDGLPLRECLIGQGILSVLNAMVALSSKSLHLDIVPITSYSHRRLLASVDNVADFSAISYEDVQVLMDAIDIPALDAQSWVTRVADHAFGRIQNLHLNLFTDVHNHTNHFSAKYLDEVQPETLRYLRSAENLKSLDLDACFSLDELFTETPGIWPRLEKVRLSGEVSTAPLLAFLRAHSSTLRSLDLHDMPIQPSASEVFVQIPKILNLEEVSMEMLWDNNEYEERDDPDDQSNRGYFLEGLESDDDRKAYFLRQNDTCPDFDYEEVWY